MDILIVLLITIRIVNWCLLVLILIGIPSITHFKVGGIGISAANLYQELTLSGLAVAAGTNLILSSLVIRSKRHRQICKTWGFIFLGFLLLECLLFAAYVNFEWFKQLLLWVKG